MTKLCWNVMKWWWNSHLRNNLHLTGANNSTPGTNNSMPGANNPTPGTDNSNYSLELGLFAPGEELLAPGMELFVPGMELLAPVRCKLFLRCEFHHHFITFHHNFVIFIYMGLIPQKVECGGMIMELIPYKQK